MFPLKVLHGRPSPEELAVVLAVVSARAAAAAAARPREGIPPNAWSDRARTLRTPLRPGVHAWRTSAWAH